VLLDFSGQTNGRRRRPGDDRGFTIEKLVDKNTAGNGIKVQADNSVFRNIKVGWDSTPSRRGSDERRVRDLPDRLDHTLMGEHEAYGARRGHLCGPVKHVIARNNDSHDNVLGIEIENTIDAEVYGTKCTG